MGEDEREMVPEPVWDIGCFKKTRAANTVLSFTGVHHARSGLWG